MGNELETDLRKLIAERRLVVVVGSGVSMAATKNAPAASWTGLLKLGVARCRELDATHLDSEWEKHLLYELTSGRLDDLLSAAEKISGRLGAPDRPEFSRWLSETVGALPLHDRGVLEALRDLHLPLVTTNYDHLLETVTGLPSATWRDQNQVFRALRGEEPAILHVHGHWKQPDSVVLGIRAYEQVRQDAHEQAVIRALAMNHSLLFVGCGDGLSDPNFKPFLAWLRGVNAHNEARHYRLALQREVQALQPQHPPEERIFVLPYGEQHADLAGFLRALAPPQVAPTPPPIPGQRDAGEASPRPHPPGLCAFTENHHDWFLRLLPGPKDAGGLPASLRFWKSRLEQGDPDRTFKVGLLYGRSGCGKSSLIKAGLIPALAKPAVLPVYVEAAPAGTPALILRELHKDPALAASLARLPDGQTLTQLLTCLRDDPALTGGRKVVLLIDQFEQWLQARRASTEDELPAALRLCDGGRLQAVLLVRGEFLDSASRFLLDTLEVAVLMRDNLGRDNCAEAQLFTPAHAEQVLTEYGRAYGRFTDPPGEPSAAERKFIQEVVHERAEAEGSEGKLVSVHLALLAELLKDRPWTPETLHSLGGVGQVGYHFLKANFDHGTPYGRFAPAALALLDALLPDSGTDLKGHARPVSELQRIAAEAAPAANFNELIKVLDGQLRLITPTEPPTMDYRTKRPPEATAAAEQWYQLTHDYLVPSLRAWADETQGASWSGQAKRALKQRAAQWDAEHSLRALPNPVEWLLILCLARRTTPAQRSLVWAASVAWLGLLLAVIALPVIGVGVWNRSPEKEAKALVEALLTAQPAKVPKALENLQPQRIKLQARPLLTGEFDPTNAVQTRLHAAFGLAAYGDVQVPFLLDQAAAGPAGQAINLTRALETQKAHATNELRARLPKTEPPEARARLATVALFLGDLTPLASLTQTNTNPTNRTAFIHGYREWSGEAVQLAEILQTIQTNAAMADVRSALCAALALMDWKTLAPPEQAALRKTMQQLYTESPDGGTHSAAACALTRWDQPLPPLPAGTNRPPPGAGWFVNSNGMTMIQISAGEFQMGRPEGDDDDKPHQVKLTRAFYMSDREVTVALFRQFASDTNLPLAGRLTDWEGEYTNTSPTANCPVQQVDWFDAVKFCNWLSGREGLSQCYRASTNAAGEVEWERDPPANGYRLPTEAEWEYACRAVSQTVFTFGDDESRLGEYAWYNKNSSNRTWPAGRKLPNLWGLFDLHGNVWEWCEDRYGPYPEGLVTNPTGPETDNSRVLRGGSWVNNVPADLSCACRNHSHPGYLDVSLGFRCVWGGASVR